MIGEEASALDEPAYSALWHNCDYFAKFIAYGAFGIANSFKQPVGRHRVPNAQT
jgi:hypothetical protein